MLQILTIMTSSKKAGNLPYLMPAKSEGFISDRYLLFEVHSAMRSGLFSEVRITCSFPVKLSNPRTYPFF